MKKVHYLYRHCSCKHRLTMHRRIRLNTTPLGDVPDATISYLRCEECGHKTEKTAVTGERTDPGNIKK